MPRRGENIRRRKDGRWEGRYSYIPAIGEKAKVRSVYAASYSEVKRKLLDAKQAVAKAMQQKESDRVRLLFTDVAQVWLAHILRNKKYSTYIKYKRIYEKYLKDFFKGQELGAANMEFMEKVIIANARKGAGNDDISDSLEKSIYCVVCQILHFAYRKMHVAVPPVKRLSQKTPRRPVQVFNLSEQKKLMDYLNRDTDLYKFGVILSLYTGLRLGELCALKWSDVDLENRIIRVSTTVQRLPLPDPAPKNRKTALLETDPKSFCSKREIPINDRLVSLLTRFRHREKYVIGQSKATDPRTYQKKFASYLKSADVAYRSFHTLRHTFASNCAAYGADAKSLSEILGHSSVQITLNRYVHPSMNLKRSYINLLPIHLEGQEMGQAG